VPEEDSQGGPPRRLADRYEVREEVGAGATAITYRGWDERLQRFVAIKILRQHVAQDEVFVRRFEREARAAASVSHGNVVDVYDVGREDGVLYIVMQLVEGEDLKRLIQRDAPLPLERVRSIIGQVLDGLAAIHRAGIIHRDIKPQNILIGRDGVARLTDFGIAQAGEDTGMTTEGTTVGTAAYMAPEQAQAGHLTEATDLYGVGVMMYEMLTGFLPFTGPSNMAMMLEHIQTPPLPPSQRAPGTGIVPAVDAVVLQAMAKNPGDRFQSARAMKQAAMQALSSTRQGTTQATVAAPVVRATRPAPAARPAPPRRYEVPADPGREGGALGGVVTGFALLLVLAIAGIGGWYAYDYWNDSRSVDGPSPTETVPAVVPTATVAPTATTEADAIGPVETEEVVEPEPTATEEPDLEPEPTEEEPLIEPMDGTPYSNHVATQEDM